MHEQQERHSTVRKLLRKKLSIITVMLLIIITAIVSNAGTGKLFNRLSGQRNPADMGNDSLRGSNLKAALVDEAPSVVKIARKAGPSVVGIRTTVRTSLERFFGTDQERTESEGSGIIINQKGFIMTNYHVVEYADPRKNSANATNLEVFLPDKRQAQATFVGGDPVNDLAVIKINLKKLPVAELGNSAALKVGALAVAIGNPLGLEFAGSVTSGVISALNRTVSVEDRTLQLIQTDAAINPGNSGGALVDTNGKVVGVNTVKISVSGVEGLGFAIPIDDAKPIVNQLMKYGYVKGRPLLGISGREISQEAADYYNLPVGIYIVEVAPGSGAAKAGIRKKDILVQLDQKKVVTMQEVNRIKKAHKAGDTVTAVVVRGRKKLNLKVTFSEER